jgi:hypothetical protein
MTQGLMTDVQLRLLIRHITSGKHSKPLCVCCVTLSCVLSNYFDGNPSNMNQQFADFTEITVNSYNNEMANCIGNGRRRRQSSPT